MNDEERIELQMVSRYQDRLVEARRMKMWGDADKLREARAREALRLHRHWPDVPNDRQRPGWREVVELLAAGLFAILAGASAAFGLWKLFN